MIIVAADRKISWNEHVLSSVTAETPIEQYEAFVKAIKNREAEFDAIMPEYEEKRKWNYDNFPNGKNWPVFRKLEKLLTVCAFEAGLKDS